MKIMIALIVLLAIGLTTEASAGNTVLLAKYCDCLGFQTANLPVFARSESGASLAHYRSHDMQNCVDIKLGVDAGGRLQSVEVGDGKFALADLAPGPVFFGVRKKAAHAMELVDFDLERGGTLRFSFLKSFNLFDAFHDDFTVYESGARRARTPEELREILRNPNWQTAELQITRNSSQEWILSDEKGQKVDEILALIKGRQLMGVGFATGIADMVFAGQTPKTAYSQYRCQNSRH